MTELVDLPAPTATSANGAAPAFDGLPVEGLDTSTGAIRLVSPGSKTAPAIEPLKIDRGGRALGEGARKMLTNIDQHGTATAPEPAVASEPSPTAPAGASPAPASPAPAVTPAAQPEPPKVDPADFERITAANRALVTEVEALKARAPRRELSAREKALDEAEKLYADDSVGALRRFLATAMGVDPASKEVDAELKGLYQDLTERELEVAMEPSQKAVREASRTRLQLARDRRERAQPAPEPDPGAKQDAEMSAAIASAAPALKLGERYPLVMQFAEVLDSAKPEMVLWREVQRLVQAGELASTASDQVLIETAASRIQTRYQDLAERLGKARTPSTATAPTPPSATDKQSEPNKTEARTITNANASVAPATPPVTKSDPAPTESKKPLSEKERRRQLAAKFFG